jgi:broad specificity phosphatase PhoE
LRLYLIRHADPDYPNNTITEAGHLEAQALAKRLASLGVDRLYSSPLGRARHTLQYTADLVKMEAVIEDWTQELSGLEVEHETWGRLGIWDLPGEVYRAGETHPAHDTWHTLPPLAGSPAPETLAALGRASDAFLLRHGYAREGRRYRIVRPNRERLAVFCHGAFGLSWLSHLLELPLPLVWSGFWLPPSSVTTILMEERSPEWAVPRCVGLGDVSHLYEASLPVSPRGIYAQNW